MDERESEKSLWCYEDDYVARFRECAGHYFDFLLPSNFETLAKGSDYDFKTYQTLCDVVICCRITIQ